MFQILLLLLSFSSTISVRLCVVPVDSCPMVLCFLFWFLIYLCPLCFLDSEVSIDLSLGGSLLSYAQSPRKSVKGTLHFCDSGFDCQPFIWFFLRFPSLCLCCPPRSCTLSALSIRTLACLVIYFNLKDFKFYS